MDRRVFAMMRVLDEITGEGVPTHLTANGFNWSMYCAEYDAVMAFMILAQTHGQRQTVKQEEEVRVFGGTP